MTAVAQRLLERAEEFLASAESDAAAGRPNAAHENARTAAELAGKALLHAKNGQHPREHAIGGLLHQAGLLPASVDPRQVARFLKERTRADYGFDRIGSDAAAAALAVARALVLHARGGTGT